MNPRASQGTASAFSRGVADTIGHMIGMSGYSVVQVLADAGISRNYYYKRARYELPFNTNDISQIAQALGITPDEIISEAISRSTAAPANVIVGSFGQTAPTNEEIEIPENVEEEWAGKFAAHPKGDETEDHTP